MAGQTAGEDHLLGGVAGEPASDQNVACLHLGEVHVDHIDDTLFEERPPELLQKQCILRLLVVGRPQTEHRNILVHTITSDPEHGRCDCAVEEGDRVGAVCEKAEAVAPHIFDLPGIGESQRDALLASEHVKVVIVAEGRAHLQMLDAEPQRLLQVEKHASIQLGSVRAQSQRRLDIDIHEAAPD